MLRIRLLAVIGLALAAVAPLAAETRAIEPRAVTPRGPLLAHEQALVRLFNEAAPSVAYITTEQLRATGFFTATVAQGAGSGFVWDSAGHVVTNHHVVEGARRVFVRLDSADAIEARVVGAAPEYDLAVVKLAKPPPGLRACDFLSGAVNETSVRTSKVGRMRVGAGRR